MGRSRKEQSQNKPTIRKEKEKEGVKAHWWRFYIENIDKKGSPLFLPRLLCQRVRRSHP